MEHAKIYIVTPIAGNSSESPANAAARTIDVMFNPTELTVARNMSYADIEVPGLPVPLVQFVRGEAQTLSLELFLDASDRVTSGISISRDDRTAPRNKCEQSLAALRKLVTIDSHLHAPPVVRFEWGSISFQGVATQFTEKFQMFDSDGRVVRARVTLQLKSYVSAETLYRDLNRQSPDRTKTRALKEGERLDLIAAQEYGDPSFWPVIARANRISRPRVLAPGLLLIIPPLD
jgi:hypothetical protein